MRAAAIKTGLLTLVSLAVLLVTIFWLRGRGLVKGDSFEVLFDDVDGLRAGAPVQLLGLRVGFVDAVEATLKDHQYKVKVNFSIQSNDIAIPQGAQLSIEQAGIIGEKFIEITPQKHQSKWTGPRFVVENPLRMKQFLKVQVESAEALRVTNERITALLSPETLQSLSKTLSNTEQLTVQLKEVLSNAQVFLTAARQDADTLVATTKTLSTELTALSRNLNEVAGNPKFKTQVLETVASLRQSAQTVSDILAEAKTVDINRANVVLKQVDASLLRVDGILSSVEQLTIKDKGESLDIILKDARETAQSLKQFSKKLNGHFSLFKLMF